MRKPQQKGFTLIELIIYLAIVSIVLVSISYLIIDIISGQTRANAGADVNHNSRFISQILSQDIRAASDIGSLTASDLTLTMPGDDITYAFVPGDLTLTRQVGVATAEVLNSNRVEITGNFTDRSYTTRNKNVGVTLVVEYKNPSNQIDYNASSTQVFSVELRGRR